ncbi:MAG: hypothetical protein NW224_14470 [Leptolyngbyaceae cyanobacterium bins.302]|nr:hypothetical protein [Leptolyngbyaceae cyanobacterium bins.302]
MSKPIFKEVDDLPNGGLTVTALKSLDFLIPGQWQNLTGFDNTIRAVTGETDEALIQQIGERAVALYNDKSQGYQRALWLYDTVETGSGLLGAAALANRIGQDSFLGFLKNITPKPEKAQSIDLCVKLVTELVAFCQINGIPGDSIGDFLAALGDYSGESLMRMAALVSFDGVIPLGPEFAEKALGIFDQTPPKELEGNQTYKSVQELIPGGGSSEKKGFITKSFDSTKGWMKSFVADKGVTQQGLLSRIRGFIEFTDDKADYVGALLDMNVKYYRHTGLQTLARRLVERAVAEI